MREEKTHDRFRTSVLSLPTPRLPFLVSFLLPPTCKDKRQEAQRVTVSLQLRCAFGIPYKSLEVTPLVPNQSHREQRPRLVGIQLERLCRVLLRLKKRIFVMADPEVVGRVIDLAERRVNQRVVPNDSERLVC